VRTAPILGLLAGLPLLAALPLGASPRLSIAVTPIIAYAPANVRVKAHVEASADNRALQIVADSSEFYRSSEIPLNGDRAPRTTVVEFRNLPGGTYNVTAILVGATSRTTAVQQIKVVKRALE
jgi:hypothetical protein